MRFMELKLPDFDDLVRMVEIIASLELEVGELELKIDSKCADLTKLAMTDPSRYVNQKVPSMEYIKTAVLPVGFDGELVDLRLELNNKEAELHKLKELYKIQLLYIEVWRTHSANERKSLM